MDLWINKIFTFLDKHPMVISMLCFSIFLLKDHIPSIIKAIKGGDGGGVTQVFHIGHDEKLPETDLSKVLSENPPWDLSTTCNMEELCFVSDSQLFAKQVIDFVDGQRNLGIMAITFNFMKVEKLNNQFCDAFKSAAFRILSDNHLSVKIIIPIFAKDRLKALRKDLQKIIDGSNKNTISIRDGLREEDM